MLFVTQPVGRWQRPYPGDARLQSASDYQLWLCVPVQLSMQMAATPSWSDVQKTTSWVAQDDTIERLLAYSDAGADCLYAPGLKTREEIQTVVSAVAPKPVNVLIGWASDLSVQDLADLGVRRISVGGALARAAWGGFITAARTMSEQGRFDGFIDTPSGAELNKLFGSPR
jgi:2-methylisocitrate lyase-like PEP mutase family enzyme